MNKRYLPWWKSEGFRPEGVRVTSTGWVWIEMENVSNLAGVYRLKPWSRDHLQVTPNLSSIRRLAPSLRWYWPGGLLLLAQTSSVLGHVAVRTHLLHGSSFNDIKCKLIHVWCRARCYGDQTIHMLEQLGMYCKLYFLWQNDECLIGDTGKSQFFLWIGRFWNNVAELWIDKVVQNMWHMNWSRF